MYENCNYIKNLYNKFNWLYEKVHTYELFCFPVLSENILNSNFIVQFQAFVKLLFNFICKFSGVSV